MVESMNSQSIKKQKHTPVNIVICPGKVFKTLLYIISCLLVANIIVLIMKYNLQHRSCYGLVPMFDFDAEMNIPTFYSSAALLFSSVLIAIIALGHKKKRYAVLAMGRFVINIPVSSNRRIHIHP